jgi:hypothetical protein
MPANRIISPRLGRSQKVSNLTDAEFRVWVQYLLAADDFGIMPLAAASIQSGSKSLASKPSTVIRRCLEHIISVGLVLTFEHQEQTFIYQSDWQDYQKVKWPAKTINPAPPVETLSDETQWLFQVFPGGQQVPKRIRGSSVEVPSKFLDGTFPRHQTLTANSTPSVGSLEESPRETTPPFDRWFWELHRTYPEKRRSSGPITEQLFIQQFQSDTRKSQVVWAEMMGNLQTQVAGHEWRVKGMVPKLEKWLRDGLWRQRHEAAPVEVLVNDRTAGTLAAAQEILKGRAS